MSVQRIVEESPAIELQSENQYTSSETNEPSKYHIKFEQIYLSKVNRRLYKLGIDSRLIYSAESLGERWNLGANDAKRGSIA